MTSTQWSSLGLVAFLSLGCGTSVESVKSAESTTASGTTGAGGATAATSTSSGTAGGFVGVGGDLPLLDAGAGCASRPEACPVPEDPSSPGYIQHQLYLLFETCGGCGYMDVTFDDAGCATTFDGGGSGDWQNAAACVTEHLDAERWSCAAGQSVETYVSCTIK